MLQIIPIDTPSLGDELCNAAAARLLEHAGQDYHPLKQPGMAG